MKCRSCGSAATLPFIDLVTAPPSNSYLRADQLNEPETYYPLKVFVCENCWLVQVDEFKSHDEIFSKDYAYYSSYSSTWLQHSEAYVQAMIPRLGLGSESLVVEVASNDGYLLQYFQEREIPCLGIEPSAGPAEVARERGVDTWIAFFGADTAKRLVSERGHVDLALGNNVLAHVPDINDFVEGFRIALKPTGVLTVEFPHVLNLIHLNQFDTIYHEHFSYLSLSAVQALFASHCLTVFDVEELPTHGGSLRVFARHAECDALPVQPSVEMVLKREEEAGFLEASGYAGLQAAANRIRSELLAFLYEQRKLGKRVVAYGAAAKGNTLLNYCGIKGTDLIMFVADASPHKQGTLLPGSHIPVVSPAVLEEGDLDFVVILPWNIRSEIVGQLRHLSQAGTQFVTAIPTLQVFTGSEDAGDGGVR